MGLTAEGSDEIENSRKFVEDLGIEWPNAYGAGATIAALGVQGLPTVLLVGADGKVLWNDELGGALDDAIGQALGSVAVNP